MGGEPKLRKWIALESQKEKVIKAIDDGNFPDELFSYLSIALNIKQKWFEDADWTLLIRIFYEIVSKSPQVKLPITLPSNEPSKEESWDYPGRTWHLYSHLLAKNYGWTMEYISQLQVEDALAKIQEITVDDQLEHEFRYGLSELAYSYDQRTKQSKFHPMPRPHWMQRKKIQPVRKFKIPASMLPMGAVIMDNVLPDDLLPKEIH